MKKSLFAAVLAAALAPLCASAEEIAHAVSAASVFTDRAVVTRTGTAHLKKGRNEIVFSGIRDGIDLRSIRAGTGLPDGVNVLGVSWERRVSETADSEKVAAVEARLAELLERKTVSEKEFSANWSRLQAAQTFENLFLRSVSVQSASGGNAASGETWTTDAAALKAAIEKIYARATENSLAAVELDKEIEPVRRELDEIYGGGNARRTVSLIVTLEAENETDAEIPVCYTTRHASWTPRYDARVSGEAGGAGTVELAYDGMISQRTGEDWRGVKLTLSTAQPQVGAFPPEVRPVALSGRKIGSPGEREIVEETASELVPVAAAERAYSAPDAEPVSGENGAFSRVRAQGAAVTFDIAGTHDVPSGEQPRQVAIARSVFENVPLNCEAAPALRGGVYLRADMKNETPYPILDGAVSIFRDSGFIGESTLEYAPVGAAAPFFAGTLDGLSVSVEKLAPYRGKSKKMFSSSKTESAEGEIYTLSNITDTPRKVRVRAQIKVSEIDDVKISILEKPLEHVPATTPGFTLEKETGMLYWDVEVPANGETRLVLSTKTERK